MEKHKKNRLATFDWVNNTVLVLVSLICVYPFLYVLFVATSDGVPLALGQVTFLPKGFQLRSFEYIFQKPSLQCGARSAELLPVHAAGYGGSAGGDLHHRLYAEPQALRAPALDDAAVHHHLGV